AILGPQLQRENPKMNEFDPKLSMLPAHVSGRLRPALLVLAGAVGVVMLIVCANLSNLLLARSAARQKEIAIRVALGAERRHLLGQILTESVLLSCSGAALGVVLAFLGARVVAEISLACVLLASAGLLIRSFLHVLDVNLGFAPEHAMALRIDPNDSYKTQEQKNAYFTEALHDVMNVPGIEAAGLSDALP